MTHPLENTTASEKDVLVSFLIGAQQALAAKARGISDADARRPMVPSGTSLAGLIKHSAYTIAGWLHGDFLGSIDDVELPWPTDPFAPDPHETIEVLLERYREQCRIVNEIVAAHDLDELSQGEQPGRFNLRWIMVHLIEELSRHTGHADILREQIDGKTGYP